MEEAVSAMLTDFYQLTMAYTYWKHGREEETCAFEVFFRKAPFGGAFTIFAGLHDFLRFLSKLRFTEDDVDFIREQMPQADPKFFVWLQSCDVSKLVVRSVEEGTVVFPQTPLVSIEGPLGFVQLVESTLLNLTNFASLVCTNALRHRVAAGPDPLMVEFGLRRAQGPNGALTASLYSYVGGFDATSNVEAAKAHGIPLRGTHAHSLVQTFSGHALEKLDPTLVDANGTPRDFRECVSQFRKQLHFLHTNEGELAAFISFAQCFPHGFVALIDTYDSLQSGLPNFIVVALALLDFGFKPIGVRLDSGDLISLSRNVRRQLREIAAVVGAKELAECQIMASNNINEDFLLSLRTKEHEITSFGIGTHLVTCEKQPALGCVFKLVEISSTPRMKTSEDKRSLPCVKHIYRLLDENGFATHDVLTLANEDPPKAHQPNIFYALDLITEITVTPVTVRPLHSVAWPSQSKTVEARKDWTVVREYTRSQHFTLAECHRRLVDPEPYPVAISQELRRVTQEVMQTELHDLPGKG